MRTDVKVCMLHIASRQPKRRHVICSLPAVGTSPALGEHLFTGAIWPGKPYIHKAVLQQAWRRGWEHMKKESRQVAEEMTL